ncbi:MAG: helix-turn-helix domain-containing protein [Reyranellaceae bacterium]
MALAAPRFIEPVRRAFAVLEALNRRRTGTLGALVEATGLPKPTIARLLETLIALGYVSHVSRAQGYRVTDRVVLLSAGARFVHHVADIAVPEMRRFTRESGWPLYLGTVSGASVAIRYTTSPESPLSFEPTGYADRFPVLESAIGRAWLAFCPEDERRTILREIETGGGTGREAVRDAGALHAALAEIRAQGFAFTRSTRQDRLNGLAVPILGGGHVLGCLSMRFPKSAMSESEAARRYLAPLAAIAGRIADAASVPDEAPSLARRRSLG